MLNWRLFGTLGVSGASAQPGATPRFLPVLEQMEDRAVPSAGLGGLFPSRELPTTSGFPFQGASAQVGGFSATAGHFQGGPFQGGPFQTGPLAQAAGGASGQAIGHPAFQGPPGQGGCFPGAPGDTQQPPVGGTLPPSNAQPTGPSTSQPGSLPTNQTPVPQPGTGCESGGQGGMQLPGIQQPIGSGTGGAAGSGTGAAFGAGSGAASGTGQYPLPPFVRFFPGAPGDWQSPGSNGSQTQPSGNFLPGFPGLGQLPGFGGQSGTGSGPGSGSGTGPSVGSGTGPSSGSGAGQGSGSGSGVGQIPPPPSGGYFPGAPGDVQTPPPGGLLPLIGVLSAPGEHLPHLGGQLPGLPFFTGGLEGLIPHGGVQVSNGGTGQG